MQNTKHARCGHTILTSLLTVATLCTTLPVIAQEHPGGRATLVFATQLPNVPGKALTAVVVRYAPGEASPAHHHAGSVYAYVLSGAIRSQNSATGPAKVYRAGESFFEPPGSDHLISANASATEPASLLAVFVADDHATLTMPDR